MKQKELHIGGMSCNHCVHHVTKALQMIDGVEVEEVINGKARIWYDEDRVDDNILKEKIEEAGYQFLGSQ